MKHRCPVCHKTIKTRAREKSEEAQFFPFCSERCKLIDLGEWLDAKYKISTPLQSKESAGPTEDISNNSTGNRQNRDT